MGAAGIEPGRRRMIAIRSASGDGEAAAIEFGDPGRAIDVIFLHANGFNALTYRQILAPLAAEMRLLAVDLRGHGHSRLAADPEGRTDWTCFRDDLLGLLEALDGPPVIMAGHSMGGCTTLLAAPFAPDRIRSMAFFDPVILPRGMRPVAGVPADSALLQGALRRRAQFDSKAAVIAAYTGRGAFRSWTGQMLQDYVEDGFKPSPGGGVELACTPAWEAANFASQAHDPWPGLTGFPRRIRILRAETGSTARIEDELDALTARGNITVASVPDTSHFLPMERPDLVQATLREAVAD
jgi:pimeloyl-ACP methyl ester carboxylesterase